MSSDDHFESAESFRRKESHKSTAEEDEFQRRKRSAQAIENPISRARQSLTSSRDSCFEKFSPLNTLTASQTPKNAPYKKRPTVDISDVFHLESSLRKQKSSESNSRKPLDFTTSEMHEVELLQCSPGANVEKTLEKAPSFAEGLKLAKSLSLSRSRISTPTSSGRSVSPARFDINTTKQLRKSNSRSSTISILSSESEEETEGKGTETDVFVDVSSVDHENKAEFTSLESSRRQIPILKAFWQDLELDLCDRKYFLVIDLGTLTVTGTSKKPLSISHKDVQTIYVYFEKGNVSYLDIFFYKRPPLLQSLFVDIEPTIDVRINDTNSPLRLNISLADLRVFADLLKREVFSLEDQKIRILRERADYSKNLEYVIEDSHSFGELQASYTQRLTKTYMTRSRSTSYSTPISKNRGPRSSFVSAIPKLDERPTILFSYPFNTMDAVTITSNELLRLPEGVYLNDSLIDFYLKQRMDKCSDSIRNEVHIFTSFFYNKLSSPRPESITKLDIFSKKYLFIPVNEHLHWYLLMIVNPSQLLTSESYGDSNHPEDIDCHEGTSSQTSGNHDFAEQCARIIIFDSLGSKHRKSAVEKVKKFLATEALNKRGKTVAPNQISALYAKVPCQQNLTDCGCFLLEYIDRFLDDPHDIAEAILARRDLSDWFHPDAATLKRLELKTMIARYSGESPVHDNGNKNDHFTSCSSDVEDITDISLRPSRA